MGGKEVYKSGEYNKVIVKVVSEGTTTIKYIGMANYSDYTSSSDTAKPIWKIRREQYDSDSGLRDFSYPYCDTDFKFVRDNREGYYYEGKEEPAQESIVLLENGNMLITEDGLYICL